jgi:hypothetical protein
LRAAIVEHGAHLAVHVAHDKVVAGAQSAILDQYRGHRTAAAIELRFQHDAAGRTRGVRAQFLQVGHQADHFQQQIKVLVLLGGNFHEHRRTTPVFRDQPAIGKLLLHTLWLRLGLVNLVDCHDDGHIRRACVVNGFQRLRHHAIIGRYHHNNNVGDLRATGTHARKGLVPRRVQKDNLAAKCRRILLANAYFVRANMLRDASGLAPCHVRLADSIE